MSDEQRIREEIWNGLLDHVENRMSDLGDELTHAVRSASYGSAAQLDARHAELVRLRSDIGSLVLK